MAPTPAPSWLFWLSQLARLKPAPWQWPRAIRAALSVGLPFAVGLALNDVMTGMWIAMGTLMMTTGEESGPYGRALRQLAIAAPMGAVGYLAGYLTGLPWLGTVVCMAGLAFVAGIISSYSATLSIGCLQFLLTAAIAIGVPSIAPFWEPALMYLVGALFYALLLGIEAAFWRERPRQLALATLLESLGDLATVRAQGVVPTAIRTQVSDAFEDLAAVLQTGQHRATDRAWLSALPYCDTIFARLLSTQDVAQLQNAATELRSMAAMVRRRHWTTTPTAATENKVPLYQSLRDLAQWLGTMAEGPAAHANQSEAFSPSGQFRPGLPSRAAVRSALALALCLGLAYATRWINPENHWFWVPLTVGLVMKPDLGSIFARAFLRSLGTLAGVAIGGAVLMLVPKNLLFAAVMALLAGVLPWAMKRSYALQAVVLTPLVLMLVDIIVPGSGDANYALQRLSDTIIGGAIVMVFGYWLWPKRQTAAFNEAHQRCREAVRQYLAAAREAAADTAIEATRQARHHAYTRLAAWRSSTNKALADPPPANVEAAAWVPTIAQLTRSCDLITEYVAEPHAGGCDESQLEQITQQLQAPKALH